LILVLTTEFGDYSHTGFINWLKYYKADYEILTGASIYRRDSNICITNDNQIIVNGRNYTEDVNVANVIG